MMSLDAIKTLANKLQTTELNVRREYIQHVFLSYFYQQPQTSKVFFKGGTALRLIFGSPRFSEDLDFSTSLNNLNDLESILLDSLQEIQREGIKVEVIESKETTGGYLAHLQFLLNQERILIELNVSGREKSLKGEVTTIASDFLMPYTIVNLSTEQLIGEKVQALLDRQKPRDFFDIYFVLRKNLLPVEAKSILVEILDVLEKTDIDFEKELKQFLPKSHWQIIRDFKNNLEKELRNNL